MAEKEERIRVLVSKNPCKECSVKKCTRKCMFGLLFEKAPGMTRTEAIKKISSHLLMCDVSTMDTDEIAETALNALLGE